MSSVTISVDGGLEKKRLLINETAEVFEFSGDSITFTPREIKLWSPENPYLYKFTLIS